MATEREWQLALHSLTPMGSEFVSSPEECVRWVRARLETMGKLAAERNRLREQNTSLLAALKRLLACRWVDETSSDAVTQAKAAIAAAEKGA